MVVILGAYRTTRVIQYLTRVCFVLLIAHCAGFAEAKDTWTKVRSNNFLLVGNANEQDIREVAVRLEQFRDGFARLLTGFRFNSAAATTVVVFKSNQAFDPFKPVYQGKPGNVAGYSTDARFGSARLYRPICNCYAMNLSCHCKHFWRSTANHRITTSAKRMGSSMRNRGHWFTT